MCMPAVSGRVENVRTPSLPQSSVAEDTRGKWEYVQLEGRITVAFQFRILTFLACGEVNEIIDRREVENYVIGKKKKRTTVSAYQSRITLNSRLYSAAAASPTSTPSSKATSVEWSLIEGAVRVVVLCDLLEAFG